MRFYLAALVCIITWMSSVRENNGLVPTCKCVGVSNTRPRINLIENYTIQSDGMCPINAVVFLMASGKTICSDPEEGWVKKAMQKVDSGAMVQWSTMVKERGSEKAKQKVDMETTVAPATEEKEQGSTTAMKKVDMETTVAPATEEKEQGSTTAMKKVGTEAMVPPVVEEKEKETSFDITPAASRASKKKTKPQRRRTRKRRQRKTTLRRMRGLKKHAHA